MKFIRHITLFGVTVLNSVAVVTAQDDCLVAAQSLVESVRQVCSEIEVNQLCYGSDPLTIQPRPNVRLDFSEPGDIVNLAALESLILSPFDAGTESFGVGVMNIRANLPDGFVSLVAFGDVFLDNLSDASSDFIAMPVFVSSSTGANIRATPQIDGMQIGSLIRGEVVTAIGQSTDNAWLLVILPSDTTGWVSTDLMASVFDLSILRITQPDEAIPVTQYGPMQAFHFRSGIDDAPCATIPDSGLLLQSPIDSSPPTLEVNGVELAFSGTLWLQTEETGETVVSVLEGQLSYDLGKILPSGNRLQYGYQGDEIRFSQPEDYNYVRARYLPLVLLPREFELTLSLGGVIFPYTPGTGFLETIPPDGTCTVVWAGDVNLRAGPGTNYPIRQGVPGGYYAEPDARAIGTDGRVWWRLAESIWIAADTTVGGGACGILPIVEPPPLESG